MLASGPPLLLCFRLSQLLGFYAETVAQLAGSGAALVAALQAAQVPKCVTLMMCVIIQSCECIVRNKSCCL